MHFSFLSLPAKAVRLPRHVAIDALRGMAMVWMTLFHFCFDLSYYGFWPQHFRTDPFWTLQRTAIVSLFLFCAGLGQAVALHRGQGWHRFGRRWLQIAACAALVSASSFAMFPSSFIYFGILHGMAIMLLIARCTSGWGRWLWWAGGVALAAPWLMAYALPLLWPDSMAFFNAPPLNALGWVTRKPFTEDYVPVFPWLGVMWWGVAAGQYMLRHRSAWMEPQWAPGLLQPLAVLGRWSLSYYMLHQPVLMGLLGAISWYTLHQ